MGKLCWLKYHPKYITFVVYKNLHLKQAVAIYKIWLYNYREFLFHQLIADWLRTLLLLYQIYDTARSNFTSFNSWNISDPSLQGVGGVCVVQVRLAGVSNLPVLIIFSIPYAAARTASKYCRYNAYHITQKFLENKYDNITHRHGLHLSWKVRFCRIASSFNK